MQHYRALIAGLAVAATAAAPAAAQETKKVDPVVVTATRVATPAEQLGVSLNVVTEDDFKTYHYTTVDEALRNVPGVEIRRSGSYGKTSSISIRGANSNQVQVLVDGVRVKSPTLGQVDLSDLSPDLIDRIEISGNTKTRDKVIRREMEIQEQQRFAGSKLRRSQELLDAWYIAQSDTLSEAALAERLAFTLIGGNRGEMSRAEMLLHVVNHCTYHRGFVADLFFQVVGMDLDRAGHASCEFFVSRQEDSIFQPNALDQSPIRTRFRIRGIVAHEPQPAREAAEHVIAQEFQWTTEYSSRTPFPRCLARSRRRRVDSLRDAAP